MISRRIFNTSLSFLGLAPIINIIGIDKSHAKSIKSDDPVSDNLYGRIEINYLYGAHKIRLRNTKTGDFADYDIRTFKVVKSSFEGAVIGHCIPRMPADSEGKPSVDLVEEQVRENKNKSTSFLLTFPDGTWSAFALSGEYYAMVWWENGVLSAHYPRDFCNKFNTFTKKWKMKYIIPKPKFWADYRQNA